MHPKTHSLTIFIAFLLLILLGGCSDVETSTPTEQNFQPKRSEPKFSSPILWIDASEENVLNSEASRWRQLELSSEALSGGGEAAQYGYVWPSAGWTLILEYQDGNDLILNAESAPDKLTHLPELPADKIISHQPGIAFGSINQTTPLKANTVAGSIKQLTKIEEVNGVNGVTFIPKVRHLDIFTIQVDSAKAKAVGLDPAQVKQETDTLIKGYYDNLGIFSRHKLHNAKGEEIPLNSVARLLQEVKLLFENKQESGIVQGIYFASPGEEKLAWEHLDTFFQVKMDYLSKRELRGIPAPFELEKMERPAPWALVFVPKTSENAPNLIQQFRQYPKSYQLEGNNFMLNGQRGVACFIQAPSESIDPVEFSADLEAILKKADHKGSVEVLNFHPWRYFPPAVVPQ